MVQRIPVGAELTLPEPPPVLNLSASDPMIAIEESWNPAEFDEVIVSTLPTHTAKWLLIDLPHRVARTTGASVTHVVARAPDLALH